MAEPLFWAVMAFLVVERGIELAIHARNARILTRRGAVWFGRYDGIVPIIVAQGVLFGGLFLEVFVTRSANVHAATAGLLGVVVLAEALRYWCIATLGDRWAIRVVTVTDAPRVRQGPYRFLAHPNYVAVMIETMALTLAFGAWWTFALATGLHLAALRVRIRVEGEALAQAEVIWQAQRAGR